MSSLEAARELSIPELLRVLDEKLGIGYYKLRETPLPLAVLAATRELEIESLEAQAREILRFIGSLRNVSSQVNRLPPEIISYIVRFVYKGDVDTRSIVPLTHVCRYWRDSIISTPSNWTLVSSDQRELAALTLQRAKAAPLTIHLSPCRLKKNFRFSNLLLPHVQNITSLSVIHLFTGKELARALPGFPKSMPNLRSLKLETIGGLIGRSLSNDPFDFSAHTLRVLSLHNFPLLPSILRLNTLTELTLFDDSSDLHLDTLLDFLEENRSLESATLDVSFAEASLRNPRHETPIGSQLRYLSIHCPHDAMNCRALVSSIALRKGADLEIHCRNVDEGLSGMLSGVSLTHLPSLSSPTFMEYRSYPRVVRLLGPGGSFLYEPRPSPGGLFQEFTPLPLDSIRELRIKHHISVDMALYLDSFPSLEVLVIESAHISGDYIVLPDPTSSSLKTLVLPASFMTRGFMAELTRFASDCENTTSASLNRVFITDQSNGSFPTVPSIERLSKYVPVVEVMKRADLPKDLS